MSKEKLTQFAVALAKIMSPVDVMFFGGLVLLCYGASRHFGAGLGPMLTGLLLVFYVKPISKWWAK